MVNHVCCCAQAANSGMASSKTSANDLSAGACSVKVDMPPDPAGHFSEDGEVIEHHIEGSLTIPTTYI